MEERKLNEKESLELITRMMQNTKMNLEQGSGNTLIIWGVTTFIVNIIVCALHYTTQNPQSHWAWMLVPIIGILWQKLAQKHAPQITTKIDKMVSQLWRNITATTIALPLIFVGLAFQNDQTMIIEGARLMSIIPFAEMLIVSIGLIAYAIIIDFKPLRIGGLVGVILSLTLLCDSQIVNNIMFGAWALSAMIIPGIKLNHYIKSQKNG